VYEKPFRTLISGDQAHLEPYSEQVVLFDGQAISFPRVYEHLLQDSVLAAGDAKRTITATRTDLIVEVDKFGIPIDHNAAIYLCFQSLFKMHPVFDTVILRILLTDRKGRVILQAARDTIQTEIIIDRIQTSVSKELCRESNLPCAAALSILSRIVFIPRVKSDELSDLLQRATVILHPFPFDGSKTAFDALDAGVPLVTYPQENLRGEKSLSNQWEP